MFGRNIGWLLMCFLLSGCEQKVLHSGLTENEANEMVALLYINNLDATKIETKDGLFRVDTEKPSFSRAVAILQREGLPRERFESLGDVFTKDGFVSSPLEERARLNYALSQEIAKTIANIDGVMMARVHLAVPERQILSDKIEPSSASVFVKHKPEIDLSSQVGKIKSMVVTAFENLPYENVTIGLFTAEEVLIDSATSSTLLAQNSGTNSSSLQPLLLIVIALGGILLIAASVYFYLRNRARIKTVETPHVE